MTLDVGALLAESGVSALDKFSSIGTIGTALRRYAGSLNGAGLLDVASAKAAALRELKAHRVREGRDLVLAAFAERKAVEPTPVPAIVPPAPEALLAAGRTVLDAPDILALVARYVETHGYAGDTRAPRLVYLALTSRLLERPVNLFLSGPSAGGKNFTVRCVCPLFPDEAFYAIAGMSPLAVMYSPESFAHRTIVISEASAFHEDGIGASLLRGLAWDAELKYDTVIDGESVRLHKDGPTGLITTGTRKLEAELATRLWTVPVPDDPKHTRAVLQATATEVAGLGIRPASDADAFVAAQRWLAVAGGRAVVVPYAQALADLVPDHEVRMRRDFTQLLTLIRAHALLHQWNRARDKQDRMLATLDDYASVYDIVQPVFSASLSAGLTPEVRATVQAVATLAPGPENTVTVTAIADRLRLSPSATWRRIRGALDGRWLVNDETRKYQPAKIRLGEPMPDTPGLPTLAELVQTCKRTPQALDDSGDGRLHDRLHAGGSGTQTLNAARGDAWEPEGSP